MRLQLAMHGCCWETCYILLIVVQWEIQPLNCYLFIFDPLPTSTKYGSEPKKNTVSNTKPGQKPIGAFQADGDEAALSKLTSRSALEALELVPGPPSESSGSGCCF